MLKKTRPDICTWLIEKKYNLTLKYTICGNFQGLLMLTQFNLNPSMEEYLHPLLNVKWYHLSIPKRQRLHRYSLEVDM